MRLTWFACALAIGCGTTNNGTTPKIDPPSKGSLELTFQSVQENGSPVAAGSTLKSGDKIALSLTMSRPAYIYVMQFFPDGTAGVLFPQEAGEEKAISGTQRIPGSGWFQLDDAVGEENVYLVASTEPLASVDAAIKQTVDNVRTSGKAPPEEPADERTLTVEDPKVDPKPDPKVEPDPNPDPKVEQKPDAKTGGGTPKRINAVGAGSSRPGRASLKSRGLTRVESNQAIRIVADAQGVAVFRFSFKHVAR